MEILDVAQFKKKVFDFETSKEWKFEGDVPTIVDFYADWCGPCKMLAPVLEELAKEYEGKVRIYKVDTQQSPELASLFHVRGIPALLFIPKEGKPTMSSGFMPKDRLKKVIGDVLKV